VKQNDKSSLFDRSKAFGGQSLDATTGPSDTTGDEQLEKYRKQLREQVYQKMRRTRRKVETALRFSKWMRDEMNEQHVTTVELEARTKLTESRLKGLTLNHRSPTLEEAYKITHALGWKLSSVITRLELDENGRL